MIKPSCGGIPSDLTLKEMDFASLYAAQGPR